MTRSQYIYFSLDLDPPSTTTGPSKTPSVDQMQLRIRETRIILFYQQRSVYRIILLGSMTGIQITSCDSAPPLRQSGLALHFNADKFGGMLEWRGTIRASFDLTTSRRHTAITRRIVRCVITERIKSKTKHTPPPHPPPLPPPPPHPPPPSPLRHHRPLHRYHCHLATATPSRATSCAGRATS
jgi:hypothetical protein